MLYQIAQALVGPNLSYKALSWLSMTCKAWYGVVNDDELWRKGCEQLWEKEALVHLIEKHHSFGVSHLWCFISRLKPYVTLVFLNRIRLVKPPCLPHAKLSSSFHQNPQTKHLRRSLRGTSVLLAWRCWLCDSRWLGCWATTCKL